jgi:hypothetical protein
LPIEIFGAGAAITHGPIGHTFDGHVVQAVSAQVLSLVARAARERRHARAGSGGAANITPRPYGVALVDLDDAASQSLTIAAPGGDYMGLELGVGLPAACNAGDPTTRAFPLNADSDMFWTWGSQYMFIRAEGSLESNGASGHERAGCARGFSRATRA